MSKLIKIVTKDGPSAYVNPEYLMAVTMPSILQSNDCVIFLQGIHYVVDRSEANSFIEAYEKANVVM